MSRARSIVSLAALLALGACASSPVEQPQVKERYSHEWFRARYGRAKAQEGLPLAPEPPPDDTSAYLRANALKANKGATWSPGRFARPYRSPFPARPWERPTPLGGGPVDEWEAAPAWDPLDRANDEPGPWAPGDDW